jgi:hypothetical protein
VLTVLGAAVVFDPDGEEKATEPEIHRVAKGWPKTLSFWSGVTRQPKTRANQGISGSLFSGFLARASLPSNSCSVATQTRFLRVWGGCQNRITYILTIQSAATILRIPRSVVLINF